jgi:hypothetical protein
MLASMVTLLDIDFEPAAGYQHSGLSKPESLNAGERDS